MALTEFQKAELVSLIHKMSPADNDNLFGMQMLMQTSPTETRTALATAVIETELTEAEGITALDALSAGIQDAAVIRWGLE